MYDGQRSHGPQIHFRWIFIPDEICPAKMPWSTKSLMGLIINMRDKHINLFKSFSKQEIADAIGGSYNVVARGQKFLIENGYINEDGEVLWDG